MWLSATRCVSSWNGWYLSPFALCWHFSSALGGRHSTDYYGLAVPVEALATCPPTLDGELLQVPALLTQYVLRQL